MTPARRFLSAEWRDLVMLNYPIDASALTGRVPAGCEVDFWSGETFVSMVGFRFLHTKVLGLAVPFHRHFEEVNLRFYVRHKSEGVWRRGVVFVKELVPRFFIALVARRVYGENYEALPMRHAVQQSGSETTTSYGWRRRGEWEGLSATVSGTPVLPGDDTEETFISEHYWGYSQQRDGSTIEYQVEHPRWRVWKATGSALECGVATLYAPEFVEALSGEPSSAFVAEGSAVVVRQGVPLTGAPSA